MKTKHNSFLKAGMALTVLSVGMICGILYLSSVYEPVMIHGVRDMIRSPTMVVGDADPGDASGFFYAMIYPHQASPTVAYASNLSNASAYEFSDSTNTSMTGETPFATTFDIVFKVGVTDTDGYNISTSAWDDAYVWCTLTCSDLSIGADTNLSELQIGNCSSYRWLHYYANNGGAGYTVDVGEQFNLTSVKFWVMRPV